MKKLLSVLLVLSMLFAISMAFTSCDALSISDVQKSPVKTLGDAEALSFSKFFSDDYGMEDIVTNTLRSGSIEFYLAQEALLGKNNSVKATLYTGNKQAASIAIAMDGTTYGGDIFVDDKGMIVSAPCALGSTALGLFYTTFEEKFADSTLAQMMALDSETANEIVDAIKEYKAALDASLIESAEKAETTANEFLALMKQTVSEEALNGEACAVITLTLDNEVLEELLTKSVNELSLSEDQKAELLASYDFDSLNESVDIDLTLKAYIALSNGHLVNYALNGTVLEKAKGNGSVSINASLAFTDTAITLSATATSDGETATFSCDLTKQVADGASVYSLSASMTEGSKTETYDILTYTFNHKTKTFSLAMDIEGEKITLKGNVATTKSTAAVSITELKMGSVGLEMDLTLTFNKDAKAPAAPTDVKDVVTMTPEEWQTLMTTVQESPLFELIGALMGSPDEPLE